MRPTRPERPIGRGLVRAPRPVDPGGADVYSDGVIATMVKKRPNTTAGPADRDGRDQQSSSVHAQLDAPAGSKAPIRRLGRVLRLLVTIAASNRVITRVRATETLAKASRRSG